MKQKNECYICKRKVVEVRSKIIDGKSRWLCEHCYSEGEIEKKQKRIEKRFNDALDGNKIKKKMDKEIIESKY